MKLGRFLFFGVPTDGQDFGILIRKHVGTQKFQLKVHNKELAVDRNMHPRMTGMYKDLGNDFENDLKLLHCSDDFDFKIIDMNDFDCKITQIWWL